ncbi:tRNA-guanine(15) transglycosylase-like protein, partial [Flagelloscypha sp. PMI_526]
RGVIPHLYPQPKNPGWVMLPFESFLENDPPAPLKLGLRELVGFKEGIVHLTLRDPRDLREMPANTKENINAMCLRGVRKMQSKEWAAIAHKLRPSVVAALSDTPFPVSTTQKRITKSIERTCIWLTDLVRPNPETGTRLQVLCPLQGLRSPQARRAFSKQLLEQVYEKHELEALAPHDSLDACLFGYVLECAPLRPALDLVDLLQASLTPLPSEKLRLATLTSNPSPRYADSQASETSPHEILALVDQVGIDLFDTDAWAIECAEVGVGFDFIFPAPSADVQRDIGHNFYLPTHANEFVPLSIDCCCPTCSAARSSDPISHSSIDDFPPPQSHIHTKAYVHHLLLTHEMSGHSLLVRHNMHIVERFFDGIRNILQTSPSSFKSEIERFRATYRVPIELMDTAYAEWARVEYERGKGRLARERERE